MFTRIVNNTVLVRPVLRVEALVSPLPCAASARQVRDEHSSVNLSRKQSAFVREEPLSGTYRLCAPLACGIGSNAVSWSFCLNTDATN